MSRTDVIQKIKRVIEMLEDLKPEQFTREGVNRQYWDTKKVKPIATTLVNWLPLYFPEIGITYTLNTRLEMVAFGNSSGEEIAVEERRRLLSNYFCMDWNTFSGLFYGSGILGLHYYGTGAHGQPFPIHYVPRQGEHSTRLEFIKHFHNVIEAIERDDIKLLA